MHGSTYSPGLYTGTTTLTLSTRSSFPHWNHGTETQRAAEACGRDASLWRVTARYSDQNAGNCTPAVPCSPVLRVSPGTDAHRACSFQRTSQRAERDVRQGERQRAEQSTE